MKENTLSEGRSCIAKAETFNLTCTGLLKLIFTRANYYSNYIVYTKHKTET